MLVIDIVGECNGMSVLINLLDQAPGVIVGKAQAIAVVPQNLHQVTIGIGRLNGMTVSVDNLLEITINVEQNIGAVLLMEHESATGFSKG